MAVLRFNSTGSMAYGYGPTIAIDGSTPAALSGRTVGGPAWFTDTLVYFQDGNTGAGPWQIHSYDTGTLATATIDTSGVTYLGAGNSVWAAFLVGSGVRTSNGLGPFLAASLGDVSSDGQIVLIDNYQQGVGLTVYTAAAASQYTLPSVALVSGWVRLIDDVLAYHSTTGWHLAPVSTNHTRFAPRVEPIAMTVAVPMSDGTITVIEVSNTQLTARRSDQAQGYVVENTPTTFWPDAMEISPGVVRIGWATNQGASPDSAVYVDLTMSSGANTRATVVAGAFVPVVQTPLTASTFTVGPVEVDGGDADVGAGYPPYQQTPFETVTDQWGQKKTRFTKPWFDYFVGNRDSLFATMVEVSKLAPSTVVDAFKTIAASGQPPITASGLDTVTLLETGDIRPVLDPLNKTVAFYTKRQFPFGVGESDGFGSSEAPVIPGPMGPTGPMGPMGPPAYAEETEPQILIINQGSGSSVITSYVPVSTGAEPLVILSNGAGAVLLTPYTP